MVDYDHSFTSADEWAEDSGVTLPVSLQVPSGKTALVRAPGIEAFMRLGMIPNTLLGMIKSALDDNSGKKKSAATQKREQDKMFEEIAEDPAKLNDLFIMVDKATVYCVVKPVVKAIPLRVKDGTNQGLEEQIAEEVPLEERPTPEEGEERWIWVDQVDMNDKMFIFNFACAGTRDAESFREELASVLDSASDVKPVARKAKRTAGDTRKGKK